MKVQIESRHGCIHMTLLPENESENALLAMASHMDGSVSGHGLQVKSPDYWERSVMLAFVPRKVEEGGE